MSMAQDLGAQTVSEMGANTSQSFSGLQMKTMENLEQIHTLLCSSS